MRMRMRIPMPIPKSMARRANRNDFVLTACLFPLLNRDANTDTRVINVASTAHNLAGLTDGNKQAGLDLNNLNGELAYNADGWGGGPMGTPNWKAFCFPENCKNGPTVPVCSG